MLARFAIGDLLIEGILSSVMMNDTHIFPGDTHLRDFELNQGGATLTAVNEKLTFFDTTTLAGKTTVIGPLRLGLGGTHAVTVPLHVTGTLTIVGGARVNFEDVNTIGVLNVSADVVVETAAVVGFDHSYVVTADHSTVAGLVTFAQGIHTVEGGVTMIGSSTVITSTGELHFASAVECSNTTFTSTGELSFVGLSMLVGGTITANGVVNVGGSLGLPVGVYTINGKMSVEGDLDILEGAHVTHAVTNTVSTTLEIEAGGHIVLDAAAKIDVDQKSSFRQRGYGNTVGVLYPTHGGSATTGGYDTQTNALYGDITNVTTMGQQRSGGTDSFGELSRVYSQRSPETARHACVVEYCFVFVCLFWEEKECGNVNMQLLFQP
jgi:hypothetical protein